MDYTDRLECCQDKNCCDFPSCVECPNCEGIRTIRTRLLETFEGNDIYEFLCQDCQTYFSAVN